MRKIKFRGKRKDNGEWIYGSLFYDKGFDAYFIIINAFDLEQPVLPEQFGVYAYEVIPESVGQYIGLKDKNGKEIYEGDIVDDNWFEINGKKIHKYLIVKFGEYCGLDYYDYPNYGFYLEMAINNGPC